MKNLMKLVPTEYGWARVEKDGSLTNGNLYVDPQTGVVQWVSDRENSIPRSTDPASA